MKKLNLCFPFLFILILGLSIFYTQTSKVIGQAPSTPALLSKNFTGIWKARIPKPTKPPVTSSSSSGECVICIQVIPECLRDQTLVPQSCTECAHCVSNTSSSSGEVVSSTSSSSSGGETASSSSSSSSSSGSTTRITLAHIDEGFKGSRIITLKLCVKEGTLEGTIHQGGVLEEGAITSQTVLSENEVKVTVKDKNNVTSEIALKLLSERQLLIIFSDGDNFEARKLNPFKACLAPSKGGGERPGKPKPDKPIKPKEPRDKPDRPADKPVKPEKPDKPVKPEKPDKPVKPEEPRDKPDRPDKPVKPEEPKDKPDRPDRPR